MCSSIWHRSLGNKKGVDSDRGRLLRWTLSSKWNKDVIISSAGLNQKPSEMWYKASKMASSRLCAGGEPCGLSEAYAAEAAS